MFWPTFPPFYMLDGGRAEPGSDRVQRNLRNAPHDEHRSYCTSSVNRSGESSSSLAEYLQRTCKYSVQVDRDPITSHHASSVQTSFNTPCKSKKIPAHAGTHHMMSTGGTVLPLRLIVATSPAAVLQSICRELVECAQVAVIPSPRIMHQFKQVSTPCKSKKIPAHAAPLGS
jgi:hypothetical protein